MKVNVVNTKSNDKCRPTYKLIKKIAFAPFLIPAFCYATNGMNLEGYGPVATAMGGASYSYENGSAAMMNNVATLGLINNGESRLNLALGFLGPNVAAENSGSKADSAADAFFMPAVGWFKKQNGFTYGAGMFAQGGMGTEYSKDSFMSAETGESAMSQISVGRLLFPAAYDINENLTIGASLDFVWASLDLRMPMTGAQLADFIPAMGGSTALGNAGGSMANGLVGYVGAAALNPANPINNVVFDFADSSDFTGEALGSGFGGKLGLVYKISDKLQFGASYHAETHMGDLESDKATVSMSANFDDNILDRSYQPGIGGAPAGTYTTMQVPITGKIAVKNFQWPSIFGVGVSYKYSKDIFLAADIKRICWSNVMDSFRMTFVADSTQDNPMASGFAGTELDIEHYQNWKDQHILSLGGAYNYSPSLVLRTGINVANNPVPNQFVHPLFPAIVRNHMTFGFGYIFSSQHNFDMSLTYALKSSATNSTGSTGNTISSHSQVNAQLQYSYKY